MNTNEFYLKTVLQNLKIFNMDPTPVDIEIPVPWGHISGMYYALYQWYVLCVISVEVHCLNLAYLYVHNVTEY